MELAANKAAINNFNNGSTCNLCKHRYCCHRQIDVSLIEALVVYNNLSQNSKKYVKSIIDMYEKYNEWTQINGI